MHGWLDSSLELLRLPFQIYCDLHFADLALMESSDFMNQLRAFKPQSLGCAVARRKSSTTLIFPLPPQACSGNGAIDDACHDVGYTYFVDDICDVCWFWL